MERGAISTIKLPKSDLDSPFFVPALKSTVTFTQCGPSPNLLRLKRKVMNDVRNIQ